MDYGEEEQMVNHQQESMLHIQKESAEPLQQKNGDFKPIAIVGRQKEVKKFKVGPIESDSGNHLVDIGSVLVGVFILYLMKKIVRG